MNDLRSRKNMIERVCTITVFTALFMVLSTSTVFANDIGENIGTWVLDQLFWIALIAVAIVVIKFLVSRAWAQAIIFIILAAIILVIIRDPRQLTAIGNMLFGLLGLGT